MIEQNYEYDLLEPAKLLHKYVGKEATLVRSYKENGTTKREEIKATLLADNNGPVWKIAGLGMPMPVRNVRVYQKNWKRNVLFVAKTGLTTHRKMSW